MIPPEAPEDIQAKLRTLVYDDVLKDAENDQASLLSQASKMDHYWRGNQHLVLGRGASGFTWTPVGQQSVLKFNDLTGSTAKRAHSYVVNIYRGDGKKFIGVLGQRAPNVKCVADRPGDEALERRAQKGQEFAGICRTRWDADKMQRDMAYIQWNGGTGYGHTHYRADKEMYGSTTLPIIENVDQVVREAAYHCMNCSADTPEEAALVDPICANCGEPLSADGRIPEEIDAVPQQTGEREYANGFTELDIYDVTSVTLPPRSKDTATATWLRLEVDRDQGELADLFPELIERVGTKGWGGSENGSEQSSQVRAQESSQDGGLLDGNTSQWRHTQIWLRPCIYYRLKKADALRDWMKETFPRGVVLVFVEGDLMDMRDEKLSEHWSYFKADVSKYINSDPIGKDFLPTCDIVNDFTNYNVAAGQRISPTVIGDPRIIDFKQYRKHPSQPGDIIPAIAGAGMDITKAFYKFPVAEMSPELTGFSDKVIDQGRENTGVTKPVFGGDSGNQTLGEAEQKRVQALMQLNIPHNEHRSFWVSAYYNAAVLFARHAAGGVQIPGILLTPEDTAEFAELSEGGFHFEAEEGMPMTWAQQRAILWDIIGKGPQVWELISLGLPANKQRLLDAVGLPKWEIAQMSDKKKADKIISLLLQQQPVMGPQGPMPSIPADEFEDDHKFMMDMAKEWAQTEEALRARTENQLGYLNVILWGKDHQFILMMQMQPAPMEPPGEGPPEAGPAVPSPGPTDGPPPVSPEEQQTEPVDAGLAEQPA